MNRTIPLILAVALFMENMDSTVISTSLPAIAADIETSPIALKLALTAYLVALAIFIPISAWMADRFGAKNVFRAAIAVFMIGSIGCAFSGSLAAFVVARFLQGMGGAMMTPVARLVLVRTSAKRNLVSAMAWLTIPGLIGPLVGPPVGGFITTFVSWHWIFLINIPIGLAGLALATRFLPDMPPAGARPFDTAGFLLVAAAASGVVFGMSVVSLPALPPIVGVVTIMSGIAAGLIYLRHMRRCAEPVLDFSLFSNPVFRASITGGSLFRLGNGATPFLLPLLLQIGFGLTPFQSGMLTFASALGALAMKFLAPVTLRTGGFRTVLVASGLLAACLVAANGLFTQQTPYGVIVAVLLGAGFLRSLFFTASNALVFADIDDKDAGQATAIATSAQQVAIAIAVAIAGLILEATMFFTGHGLGPADFSRAFFIMAAITALGVIPFWRMAADAGRAVSGHRIENMAESEQPSKQL